MAGDAVTVARFAYAPMATFGRLRTPAGFECYTVERPWHGNKPFVSCIPVGTYEMEKRRYNRGGYDTVEVKDVPGRLHILIHKGNLATDTQGCVALGMYLGCVDGTWAVTRSAPALAVFLEQAFAYGWSTITITNARTNALPAPVRHDG